MKARILPFLSIAFVLIMSACTQQEIMCTEEFRIVSLEIIGGELDSFHTYREKTGEHLFLSESASVFENFYPVLSDNEHKLIVNSDEYFIFNGYINEELVVKERFLIVADECHIFNVHNKILNKN